MSQFADGRVIQNTLQCADGHMIQSTSQRADGRVIQNTPQCADGHINQSMLQRADGHITGSPCVCSCQEEPPMRCHPQMACHQLNATLKWPPSNGLPGGATH
eukprot:1161954-Pelagomonas_calceolata.AAC.12